MITWNLRTDEEKNDEDELMGERLTVPLTESLHQVVQDDEKDIREFEDDQYLSKPRASSIFKGK